MKRMFLLPGIAVLFTLAILFTGCPQPADTTVNNGSDTPLVKLADPKVRVTAYEGFNVVSWEPVPDAASYRVWRTDTESSSQVAIGGPVNNTADLSVIDNVTDTGQKLAHGRTYKYIVVAEPDSRFLDSSSQSKVDAAQKDLYSGKGEATVKANIPDPADLNYKIAKATDIKYRLDSDGTLFVSWTQPSNAKAAIGYFPGGYRVGENPSVDLPYTNDAFLNTNNAFTYAFTNLGATSLFDISGAGYLYPRNAVYATFPVIGGNATIAIQTEYFDGTRFYAKDVPATVHIEFDQYDLDLQWKDASTNPLKATYIYQGTSEGKVQLSWSRIKGDDDIYSDVDYSTSGAEKVEYTVWKRPISVNEDSLGQVTGDWEKVSFTLIKPADATLLSSQAINDVIYATEDGVIRSLESWQYIVFASATRNEKTSYSYPLSASLTRTLPEEATITSVTDVYGNMKASDGLPYTIKISASGLRAGVSYKLYRGELIPVLTDSTGQWVKPSIDAKTGYQFTAYDQTPVQEWTGQLVTGDDTAAIYDTDVVARKSYLYKLVSSMGETLLGDGNTEDLIALDTNQAASVYSNLSLTVDPLPVVSAPATGQTNDDLRGYIKADVSNDGYTKGMDVRLFYRRNNGKPGATVTAWTELAKFERNDQIGGAASQRTDEDGHFKILEIPVPYPIYGETYQFKAVAYLNGVAIPNLNNSDYTVGSLDVVEATDDSPLSTSAITASTLVSSTLGIASDAAQTITGITGSFLDGATINVRIERISVLDGKRTYYEQPEVFTLGRTATFPGGGYQVQLILSVRPGALEDDETLPASADRYSVEWKYPWEQWETVTPRVIRSNIAY
jgi:hypothetical protein